MMKKSLILETNEWTRKSAGSRQSKPSSLEAHRIFLLNLTVSVDKKTGYIYLAYDHSSPFFCKRNFGFNIQRGKFYSEKTRFNSDF